jgi:peptidoglycan/xylan/chitin deacetylase (PgdA/CDA1 family)
VKKVLAGQEKIIFSASKKKNNRILFNIFLTALIFILTCVGITNNLFVVPSTFADKLSFAALDDTLQLLIPTGTPNGSTSAKTLTPLDELNDIRTKPSSSSATATPSAEPDFCQQVPVLYYHHIAPMQEADLLGHAALTVDSNIFADQMKYLYEHGYTTVSADDLIYAMINRQQLPAKTVVITIDDGYDDAYTYIYPVMKEYNFVASLMIPAGLIGNPGYLTWLHLKDMLTTPNIKIYNHTWSHAPVGLISKEEVDKELASSSAAFKEKLNLYNNTVFTYPYGNYNDQAIQELKKFGFYAAFTTEQGTNECTSKLMTLPRDRIGNAPLNEYGF